MPITQQQLDRFKSGATQPTQPTQTPQVQEQDQFSKYKTKLRGSSVEKVDLSKRTEEKKDEKKLGLGKSIARGLLNPFARLGTNVANIGEASYDIGRYLIGKGDWDEVAEAVDKKRTFGLGLGDFTAVGGESKNLAETMVDATGTAAEILPWLIGAGAAKTAAQPTLTGAFKAGAKAAIPAGYWGGAATAMGTELQEKGLEAKPLSLLGQGLFGAGTGSIFAGIAGGLLGTASKALNKKKLLQEALDSTDDGVFYRVSTNKKAPNILGKLDDNTFLLSDDAAQKLNKLGLEKKYIKIIKVPENQETYQKMFKVAEDVSGDALRIERPVDVAGENFVKLFNQVDDQTSQAGVTLRKTVESMPKKVLDISKEYGQFVDDLQGAGIKINSKGLDFRNSRYAETTTVQRLIEKAWNAIRPNQSGRVLRTPQRINTIRQSLFEQMNLAKLNNEITDTSDVLVKKLYDGLRKPLVELSDDYAINSAKYAQGITAINRVKQIMGKGFNIRNATYANKRAGEVMNRLLGNASARPLRVASELENAAQALGIKVNENIRGQMIFSDMLESLFNLTPTRSLGGQSQRATEKSLQKIGVLKMASNIKNLRVGSIISDLFGRVNSENTDIIKEAIKNIIFR